MNDNKSFRGKVGVIGSGRSLYVASLFILNIGLARSMGTLGFGTFQQIFIFSALFMIFSLGIPDTIYFFLPRIEKNERPAFIGQTFLLLSGSGVFVALLLWFGAPFFAEIQNNPLIVTHLRVFGIYGAFIIASSFSDPVFIIYKKVNYLFILSAVHGLFFIALTIWQYVTKCSVISLIIAMSVFGLFKFLLALMFLFKTKAFTLKKIFAKARYSILLQLMFALPIALTSTIDIISRWMDKFVISSFLGKEALGIYSVGAIEIPFVSVLVASVYSVISPKLNDLHHKKDYRGFIDLLKKTLKLTAKIVWPVCIYLFIFADHLIPLVFTINFENAIDPFRIYLFLMPVRIFLFGVVIIALGQPRILLWASMGSLALNAFLNINLVIRIGFLGPAIATVVSTYIQIFVLIWFILTNLKIRFNELVPIRTLFDVALASGLAVALSFVLTRAYRDDLNAVLMSLTIYMGAYIFIGSKLKLFRIVNITDLLGGNFLGKKD
ncbi:oligosaccharide flippase family protein [Candidatus Latescibacterota bacterium]